MSGQFLFFNRKSFTAPKLHSAKYEYRNGNNSFLAEFIIFGYLASISSQSMPSFHCSKRSTANARSDSHFDFLNWGYSVSFSFSKNNFCKISVFRSQTRMRSFPKLNQRTAVWYRTSLWSEPQSSRSVINCLWFRPLALMKLTIFTTGSTTCFMSRTLSHSTSWCIMQCRNINSLVQLTSATRSPSLFSRPTFFPVKEGEPSVVTLTIFCHGNCIVCKAIPGSSVFHWFHRQQFFCDFKVFCLVQKMSNCAAVIDVGAFIQCTDENSWNEGICPFSCDVRSSPIASMWQATVLFKKLTSSNFLLCSGQTWLATSTCTFWQIHHHRMTCCA